MSGTSNNKCTVRDGKFVQACDGLTSITQDGNPTGIQRGIFAWEYTNRDSGLPSKLFFGTKSGKHVKSGIAFNYCPMCGEKIDEPFTPKDPK